MIILEQNEHVILEIRKHWIICFSEIAGIIVAAFLPLLLLGIIKNTGLVIHLSGGSFGVAVAFLYLFWILMLWMAAFIFWTNYYLDVWVITNHRILDVEQIGLFSRDVSVIHLDKIQDISYETTGLLASLMNFGNLHVQTAASDHVFVIKGIPDPAYVQKKINECVMIINSNYSPKV